MLIGPYCMIIAHQCHIQYHLRVIISVASLTSVFSTRAIWRNADQLWLSPGSDLNYLTFPFILVPPTSAVLSLPSVLPNITQSFDNLQPAWCVLELRVCRQHQAEWCALGTSEGWDVMGRDWTNPRSGPVATSWISTRPSVGSQWQDKW